MTWTHFTEWLGISVTSQCWKDSTCLARPRCICFHPITNKKQTAFHLPMTSFIPRWLRKDGKFLWVIFFSPPPGDTLDSVEELYAFVFVSVAPKCLVSRVIVHHAAATRRHRLLNLQMSLVSFSSPAGTRLMSALH